MKKLICSIMIMVVLVTSINIMPFVHAEDAEWGEISLNEEFADDRVIIVLDNDASLKFKTYDVNDFRGINCEEVVDISENAGNKVFKAMKNIERHVTQGEKLEKYDGVPLGDYKQILCIKLKNPGKENVVEAISKLDSMEGVYVASPDYKITAYANSFNPNDDNSMDWGIYDNIDYGNLISLYDAWDITTGSKNVKVAIMDSGIDTEHEDLYMNFETTELSGLFDDGVYSDGPTADNCGHGTQVAGIICANGNNNKGIAGVCWNIEFVSLKILDDDGYGYSYHAWMAFDHLINTDVDIVNMSCGWYPISTSGTVNPRYDESFSAGITNFGKLVVCAAGNHDQNLDTFTSYPTAYNCSNVITVGATDELDNIWEETNSSGTHYKSNVGRYSVDLFAPGKRILSTYPTDICDENGQVDNIDTIEVSYGYHANSGTSFAAPFVTGVAALMLSINPNLTTAQIKDIIIRSVDHIPDLQEYCVSGGRLNAFKAVQTASNLRFDYSYTYNSIDAYSHGVICDTCECSCRTPDYSCDACNFGCDPCDGCHIYYTELHDLVISPTMNDLYNHKYTCLYCGYRYYEAHTWVFNALTQMYVCSDCGYTADAVPGIMSFSDPELEAYLATLTDAERDGFIVALPEEQAARVTALLPSDKENLIE